MSLFIIAPLLLPFTIQLIQLINQSVLLLPLVSIIKCRFFQKRRVAIETHTRWSLSTHDQENPSTAPPYIPATLPFRGTQRGERDIDTGHHLCLALRDSVQYL